MGQSFRDADGFLGLDTNTKYCLADTTVLLPLCRGDVDVIRNARQELNGAALVLLRHIVGETAHKYGEQEGKNVDIDDFAASLAANLKSARISFRFVRFEDNMAIFWKKMIAARKHPNLSEADYALLCAAVRRKKMDIMTDDRGLAGSIRRDRGQRAKGRIRSATRDYRKRRGDVAGYIRRKLADHTPDNAVVKWRDCGKCTEFLVEGIVVASVDGAGARVDLSSCIKNSTQRHALQLELSDEVGKLFANWKPKIVNAWKGRYGWGRNGDARIRPRTKVRRRRRRR